MFELVVPAGQKLPAPVHRKTSASLYGIDGVLTWTVDGWPIEVAPGQALCRGAVHRFDNFGKENGKQLVIITPAPTGPAYFREAAEVIRAAKGGLPDLANMMEVFRHHGVTLAGPPRLSSWTLIVDLFHTNLGSLRHHVHTRGPAEQGRDRDKVDDDKPIIDSDGSDTVPRKCGTWYQVGSSDSTGGKRHRCRASAAAAPGSAGRGPRLEAMVGPQT